MMPKMIVSEGELKHDEDVFKTFFNKIEGLYNVSQFESIKNICMTKQGIK